MILYPIGRTEGSLFAAQLLKKQGLSITDHPMPEITHVLLDVPSFDGSGKLRGGGCLCEVLERLPPTVTVVGGNLDHPDLLGCRKWDLMQDETYVAGNAAITADCAVRLAGEKLKAIFRDSPALILGWGRIGKCLAQLLAGLGCPVTVAARKESDRAILSALGIRALDYRELPATLDRYSLIFNTVPEMVLKAEPPETCVCIDLASRRGIPGDSVIWARGLPGVHAPRSSGKLIAERILYYLKEEQQ